MFLIIIFFCEVVSAGKETIKGPHTSPETPMPTRRAAGFFYFIMINHFKYGTVDPFKNYQKDGISEIHVGIVCRYWDNDFWLSKNFDAKNWRLYINKKDEKRPADIPEEQATALIKRLALIKVRTSAFTESHRYMTKEGVLKLISELNVHVRYGELCKKQIALLEKGLNDTMP